MSYDLSKLLERLRIVERERDVVKDTLIKLQAEVSKLPAKLQETIINYSSIISSLEEELVQSRSECDRLKDQLARFTALQQDQTIDLLSDPNEALRLVIKKFTS